MLWTPEIASNDANQTAISHLQGVFVTALPSAPHSRHSAVRLHAELQQKLASLRSMQCRKLKKGKARGVLQPRDYAPNAPVIVNVTVLPEVKRVLLVTLSLLPSLLIRLRTCWKNPWCK